MPKNPSGGPGGPFDTSQPSPDGEQRPAESGAGASGTVDASGAEAASAESSRGAQPGGRKIGERKKQFLIAPRAMQGGGLHALGLAPLSLSSIEQTLRGNPDIDIIDTVGPRNSMSMLGDGMGGTQGVLVARMTEQKASALHQQGQGRLLVERDQHLALMDAPAFLRPAFVSNITPSGGPAFTTTIQVLGKDGAPLPECEVSLFGSLLPASATTDAQGQATLSLAGETDASIRGLYIKPKADYWSFYNRDPDLSPDEPNVVTLRALGDWPPMSGFPRQKTYTWGQKAMRLDQLPGEYRGQGVRVAVIDSGVATTHEALKRVRAGFDVINKKTNPNGWTEDLLGHGTHCAGMVGAAELAFGVRGFAPEAEIHACKLFPGGQVSQLIDALEYCIDKQIDVVNLSLGGAEASEALEQQIVRARRAGIACIVAAGNSGGPVQYPASSPNVLAVAAIGKLDEFPPDSYHAQTISQNVDANGFFSAGFSCFGPQVAVCGPGVAITSTVPPNNYAAWDGTSMAAPHITGLAALVLAHHPEFQGPFKARTADRVERLFQLIKMSARRVSLGDPSRIGLGLPDVLVAVGLQAPAFSQALVAQALSRQLAPQGMLAPWMGAVARSPQFEPMGFDAAMAAQYNPFMGAGGAGAGFGQPGMDALPFGFGANPVFARGW